MRIADTTRYAKSIPYQREFARPTISETPIPSDPVHGILKAIVGVVPVTYWAFARVEPNGVLSNVLCSDGTDRAAAQLLLEHAAQRAKTKIGSRIAATLLPFGDFESGVTLLFADAKSSFGILVLLRSPASGLFSSTEVGMLAFALDAVADRLSTLRLRLDTNAPEAGACDAGVDHAVPEPPSSATYILDRDYAIVLGWQSPDDCGNALTGLRTRSDVRLPALLEETVRSLTASWDGESSARPGIAYPVPFLCVRATPLTGVIGRHIGVRIDRSRPSNSLAEAVRRYDISTREVQVLTLLLDGRRLEEIGSSLHITSSTVQDHIKSMVGKTESRNRSELIAHVFGWQFASQPR